MDIIYIDEPTLKCQRDDRVFMDIIRYGMYSEHNYVAGVLSGMPNS
jgi:hypothetical protein